MWGFKLEGSDIAEKVLRIKFFDNIYLIIEIGYVKFLIIYILNHNN